ncbi:MAG: hypothetical protein GYB26_10085 [Gammaproteobacteria bacterium]|nr:hypothetical protein [Gammaproteobacteria bacterium]
MGDDAKKNRGIRFNDAEWGAITKLAKQHGIHHPSTFVREKMLSAVRNRHQESPATGDSGIDESALSYKLVACLHDTSREKMAFSALLETFILLRKIAGRSDPELITAAHEEAKKVRADLGIELTKTNTGEEHGQG